VFERPQVNLYVRDVEVSARFYRESFGFRETFRTPRQGRPDHVELRLDGFTLGLGSIDALREMHGITIGDAAAPRAELVLWTDDVDRTHAELAARGVPTLSPPHDFLDTVRAAWMADPDGNPVQLVTRLPPES
jgi:catechol 2,3-dioxygenase-like lactoylglutathione lyase family enzyme